MRISRLSRFFPLIVSIVFVFSASAHAGVGIPKPVKEWTFLTFINGNNNLDTYGALNINQMEQIGSTDDLNIVVQWASLSRKTTQRLYIEKDTNTQKVTSPVLQEIQGLDMGNWKTLVDFVQWAHDNYPAKHYFINIWNHGNGWHLTDISFDDVTGHFITTKELGDAMRESAQIIGHKIDLYASDACLMAMVEVAVEMADSVEYFAGSEETEPGSGWPYHTILSRWTRAPEASAIDVAKIITEEYIKAYSPGGAYGNKAVTFSAFDLSKTPVMTGAIRALGENLLGVETANRAKVLDAASKTLHFTYTDYSDLGIFLDELEKTRLTSVSTETVNNVRSAISQFVVANQATGRYSKAQGVSMWIPFRKAGFDKYADKYNALRIANETAWQDTLKYLVGN